MNHGTGQRVEDRGNMKAITTTPRKRFTLRYFFGVFILLMGIVPLTVGPSSASAQARGCDEEYYSLNNIVFYNPCVNDVCSAVNAGGALTSASPSSLTGATNEEKIWNYFIARGLTPVAAAGAMGNMKQESSLFDPWAGEHGSTGSLDKHRLDTGFGLIQWTNTDGDINGRRYGVMKYLEDNGVVLNASDPSQTDKALLYELNYLWDGEYGARTWQEQVNAETTVDGDPSKSYSEDNTGNGSAMVFHKLVERSGDNATGKQERIDSAKEFLAQFDGSAARGSCGLNVGQGSLNWEQAVTLGKKIVDEWDSNFCGSGSIKDGFYCTWTSGYCTAGAAWMAVTTAPDPSRVPGIPNGVDVANRLISANPEVYTSVNPDGSNLQPFAVWSLGVGGVSGQPGHTGTVVGVSPEGKIITLELNWAGNTPGASNSFLYNPGHKVAVFEYPSFEAFKSSHGGYVYNSMATPKDSTIAAQMSTKIAGYMNN